MKLLTCSALTAAALTLAPLSAAAQSVEYGPSLFAGFAWTFGGSNGAGVTVKALSTNEPDTAGLAAGVTYYFDGTWGCDAGASYNKSDLAITLTYDFCVNGVQFGAGKILSQPGSIGLDLP